MTLPSSIRKRDGRIEVFDPDKLSRSLFSVTEAMGNPDAFLAHELADGILHFLTTENIEVATTSQLVDLTVKVVRELGHPALARVFEEKIKHSATESIPPKSALLSPDNPSNLSRDDVFELVRKAAASEIAQFSLEHVYPRDLVSAHREGLLQLLDLETPFELTGMLLPGPCLLDAWQIFEALRNVRAMAGAFVAFDGPEFALAAIDAGRESQIFSFLEAVDKAAEVLGLRVILNLNAAEPPAWARTVDKSSLFRGLQNQPERAWLDRLALDCLENAKNAHVLWHLSEKDFLNNDLNRLATVADMARSRSQIEFVFDRPGQPVQLGPGISRDRPAALGMVGMNLNRFVDHLGGGPLDRDTFLHKLASLARFAKSAGHARQKFLRQRGHSRLREGFMLERAVEIVVPMELLAAVRRVLGPIATPEEVTNLAERSLQTIRFTMASDRSRYVTASVDFPLDSVRDFSGSEPEMTIRKQLAVQGRLHHAAEGGRSTILLKEIPSANVYQVPEFLRTAWQKGVGWLRFA